MEKYNFDFNTDMRSMPYVSIGGSGISFNKKSIEALGYPQYICIGLDKLAKILAIKAAKKDTQGAVYKFVSNERTKNWVMISAMALRLAIKEICGTWDKSRKYAAKLEELGEKMLIVDLSEKINGC